MSELEKKIAKFLQSNNPEKNVVQVVNNYFEEVEGEGNIVLNQVRLLGKDITLILEWKSKWGSK